MSLVFLSLSILTYLKTQSQEGRGTIGVESDLPLVVSFPLALFAAFAFFDLFRDSMIEKATRGDFDWLSEVAVLV